LKAEKKLSTEAVFKFALCIWVIAMAKGGEVVAGATPKRNFRIVGCR